ncbi:MAG: cytochrome c biogenesis protein CcdA [Nanoarchaeota archaeon]|nr:cytochrome c biogenesis protein CcdA [Nanoarchaeota archaeon]
MNKWPIFVGLVLFLFLLNSSVINAAEDVELYAFYGQACPHCSKMLNFFESIEKDYPTLKIFEKETYFDQANRELFEDMAEAFDTQIEGVPTMFIDERVIVGFSDNLGIKLEQEIQRCIKDGCRSPMESLKEGINISEVVNIEGESSPSEDPKKTETIRQVTVPAVFFAAAVDAINPCAFAVLIILLTTILAAKKKRRVLCAGLAFTLSIFLSYFMMGVGLYSAVRATGLTHTFYAIVAAIAIVIGIFNLKDFFWYGKWFIMEVPQSWRPKLKSVIRGITSVPGAFLIGFVVSLFLLPCTSGPYIVILGMLAKTTTKDYAFILLFLYNLIFVMPMIIITFAIYFGFTSTEKAEEWRKSKLKVLHLIAGIIMLLLGIGMFISIYLGFV